MRFFDNDKLLGYLALKFFERSEGSGKINPFYTALAWLKHNLIGCWNNEYLFPDWLTGLAR